MPLVKINRTIPRYEITKTQAAISLNLGTVIDWTADGEYLIAELSEVAGVPLPPLDRRDRKFTLTTLDSIYSTLEVPVDLRERITVTFTATHIVFLIGKELA
jgi:hypothetical protein